MEGFCYIDGEPCDCGLDDVCEKDDDYHEEDDE